MANARVVIEYVGVRYCPMTPHRVALLVALSASRHAVVYGTPLITDDDALISDEARELIDKVVVACATVADDELARVVELPALSTHGAVMDLTVLSARAAEPK